MRNFILLLAVLFVPVSAYAYLDPGSGGILFQILAAIAVTIGIFWRKLKRLFTGRKGEQEEIDKAVQDMVKNDPENK